MSGGDALLLGVAALVPVALLALTSFVKITVVLSLLRNALGTNDAPSSLVVMGLGLVLSGVVMAPVVQDMVAAATAASASSGTRTAPSAPRTIGPSSPVSPAPSSVLESSTPSAPPDWRAMVPAERQGDVAAALAALEPLRKFLTANAEKRDREAFAELSRSMGRAAAGDELSVVAPAFITSELTRAFLMAIVLLLPFLVIDLVVGFSLAALGATSMSPQTVALPLKLLLFVAVDGWRLLVQALVGSYA